MIDREELQPNREYVDAAVGTTDQAAPTDGRPEPWYKQYLDEMKKKALGQVTADDPSGMPTRDDKLSPYKKMGAGIHNVMSMAMMANGGVVAGPTLALIGEGGEPEYVVPESKVLPFAQHTMRTGNPPNPAKLERSPKTVSSETVTVLEGGDPSSEGEIEVPDADDSAAPLAAESDDPILCAIKELSAKVDALAGTKGSTPAMAKGGKVVPRVPKVPRPKVPHMADGGMVVPRQFGPPKPFMLPPNPANPYAQPDLVMDAPPGLPVDSAAPTFPGAMPQLQRPTMPLPPRMTGAQDKYAALLKAAPKPKWYEAMMAQPNQQHYGTGPVASYAGLGAGIRNTIGAVLPFNRKQADYQRELDSAKAGMGAEKQANDDALQETRLRSQLEGDRARIASEEAQQALYAKQQAKLDQPEKVKKSDLQEKLELFDASFPGADPSVRQQLFGIKVDKPEELYTGMQQVTDEHGNVSFVPVNSKNGTVGDPVKTTAKGKGKEAGEGADSKLLTPAEAAMLGVPYGTTRAAAAGKQPATEAQKTTGQYASRIAQSNKLIDEIGGGQTGWAAGAQGWLPNFAKSDDRQSFEQAERNFINAKLRRESGAVISPSEFTEARAQYIPQPGDSEKTLKQKADNRKLVERDMISASGNAYEPPPGLAPPGQHKAGDKVMLGGKEVTIKKINADGTFEY